MAVKNKSSKGNKLVTALICVGVVGAACVGLLVARFVSGRSIFDMTRQSVTENIQPTQIEEQEQVQEQEQEHVQEREPTEYYTGIDNDRMYFLDENGTYIPHYEAVEENTLDPELFYTKDSKVYYNSEKARYGVDVSSHQEKIDWAAVKAAGMDFVMLRAGYRGYGEAGSLNPDEMFIENAKGAIEAGIDVGAYFFSQAITVQEAIEEAEFVLDMIKDLNITYPIAFDWEEITNDTARTDDVTSGELTAFARAFCDTVSAAGHIPAVYLNVDQGYMKYDLEVLDPYELWIASYKDKPDFYYDFDMWQYSSEGSVEGINWTADLNISFKDYSETDKTEE